MPADAATFRMLRRSRAGSEATISFLKWCVGWTRCTWRSLRSFTAYAWTSVVTANLLLRAPRADRRQARDRVDRETSVWTPVAARPRGPFRGVSRCVPHFGARPGVRNHGSAGESSTRNAELTRELASRPFPRQPWRPRRRRRQSPRPRRQPRLRPIQLGTAPRRRGGPRATLRRWPTEHCS